MIRCADKTGGQDFKITLTNCKITKNGTTLKDIGTLSVDSTTGTTADGNGLYWREASQENDWTGQISYYAGEWNNTAYRMDNGASAEFDGATFTATLKVDTATELPAETKAEYYYCIGRTKSDYKKLVDTYMEQGVNVFRLPVTWTWFTQNTSPFTIDADWLKAVKETVDYILSKGAYCILNLQGEYLNHSFVAKKDTDDDYTNFHWEDQWMDDQYKDYVDARFAAIWKQIATYFKDCSDHLIFEACNEPVMKWVEGVGDVNSWRARQATRVNGLNKLFVDTVRETQGNNTTRLLCLAVADYNSYNYLSSLDATLLPSDSKYLIVQLHSYSQMEKLSDNSVQYDNTKDATDAMFGAVKTFQDAHPTIPVIVGEVGLSHSLDNIGDEAKKAAAAQKVKYFFEKATAQGVPCLWWEDYFQVPDEGSNSTYWIYNKKDNTWRSEILEAIQSVVGTSQTTGYTVSFNANGGSGTMNDVTNVSGAYTLPGNGFTAPNNKRFKGWATSKDGDVISGTTEITANTTLYAIWEDIPVTSYTVSFNANGGTGTMNDVTNVSGSYTLPGNGFTAPDKKRFKGWATSAGGDVISATTINVTDATTLYAIWEDIPVTSYTVSFNANGGSGSMNDVTNVSGSYTLPENGFTAPAEKQFKGWATSADGDVISDATIEITANTTLYAIWENIPVTPPHTPVRPAPTPTPAPTPAPAPTPVEAKNPFADVDKNDAFYDAVVWAVRNGITTGTSASSFAPEGTVKRAQLVTFLWRAAGQPEPVSAKNRFTDVGVNEYYYKALLWAMENGITTGTTATTFSPDETCTRAQAVAFLFRYAVATGMDAVTLQELLSGYQDASSVPDYAISAFHWALSANVVLGANGSLMPGASCTRAQIVMMLYRLLG